MLPMEKKSGSSLVHVSGWSASEKGRGHFGTCAAKGRPLEALKRALKPTKGSRPAQVQNGVAGQLRKPGDANPDLDTVSCCAVMQPPRLSAKKTEFTIASPATHRLPLQTDARLYAYYGR